jgi:hypothetical protein
MYGTDTCLWEIGAVISGVSLFELIIDQHASHRLNLNMTMCRSKYLTNDEHCKYCLSLHVIV